MQTVPGMDPGKGHRDQMTALVNYIWEAKNDVLV